MDSITAGLYARVSSDGQARGNTVASQIAALRERAGADGTIIAPDNAYVDEGWSGTVLVRPALERLRDAIAAGTIDRVYVLAPDRLARRYAYQVLLVEEFRRAGVEVVFLNRAIGGSAEDDLLLQVQGIRSRLRDGARHGGRNRAQIHSRTTTGRHRGREGQGRLRRPQGDSPLDKVRELHASGVQPSAIAKETGLSRIHVYRLTKDLPVPVLP